MHVIQNQQQKMFSDETTEYDPSQLQLLSSLIEESEEKNRKNPEEERARKEEEEYARKRREEEERILNANNGKPLSSSSMKIEEIDKLKGTRAERLNATIWTDEDLEDLQDEEEDDRQVPE